MRNHDVIVQAEQSASEACLILILITSRRSINVSLMTATVLMLSSITIDIVYYSDYTVQCCRLASRRRITCSDEWKCAFFTLAFSSYRYSTVTEL